MGKVLKVRGIEDAIIEQQCDEVNIKNIEKELIKYIEEEIFPLYSKNEEGHGIKHIKTVIERSLKFAKEYDVNLDIVYTVAAYHDIGHYIDRKKHYAELSEEEQIERIYQHLKEKYGENGYAKVYLQDKEFDEAIIKLRKALSNKEEFIERIKNVIRQ